MHLLLPHNSCPIRTHTHSLHPHHSLYKRSIQGDVPPSTSPFQRSLALKRDDSVPKGTIQAIDNPRVYKRSILSSLAPTAPLPHDSYDCSYSPLDSYTPLEDSTLDSSPPTNEYTSYKIIQRSLSFFFPPNNDSDSEAEIQTSPLLCRSSILEEVKSPFFRSRRSGAASPSPSPVVIVALHPSISASPRLPLTVAVGVAVAAGAALLQQSRPALHQVQHKITCYLGEERISAK
ncbi:hypothetical protein Ccrd_005484 [Cynara cardunculus var. scolymus]|uniref:Uncharacterized protein n=1 Tax=Cynara cardunculus var. scolymus TaxID=59895 RepID=A0A103XKM5_CYNCS|nr:hypothetical protein Ccrd_005484 [Cynara cardunculus var. scolymus]